MRAAHDMAFATAVDLDIDVVVVSEPNKKIIEGKRWCKDKRQDVAILFHNQKTRIKRLDIGEGMIAIHFQSFVMYCVYCSPNINLDQFKQEIDNIMEKAESQGTEFIIMGDLNVKSPVADPRGEYLTEWLADAENI
ncbi:Endonuclease-reverse transcriptase [Popillia japonica]|uniref:Endonuclease-reverse transcriptase n=1 Tax=Popillia japonica TaxID=7064 RepID=A0AAW1KNP0_POPJA